MDETLAGTRSIVRTCDILRLVGGAADGLTVTEVGLAVGLPKSSAHRYLAVLESQRFVERDGHNKYRLGLGILSLQSRQTESLVQRARPLMEAIRNQFNETVNLGVLSRNRVVYLEILESTKGVRHSAQKGDEDFVHSTALGKAIAARMSEREVLELLARTGMERRTGKTITDPRLFLKGLAAVRTRGYALDDGENEPEARCVAVLIPGLSVPAALSVSGVAARFPLSEIPQAAAALKDAASQLSAEPASASPPPEDIAASKAGAAREKKAKRGRKRR
jgi:IclR family acetate operon transcriptional repressor